MFFFLIFFTIFIFFLINLYYLYRKCIVAQYLINPYRIHLIAYSHLASHVFLLECNPMISQMCLEKD